MTFFFLSGDQKDVFAKQVQKKSIERMKLWWFGLISIS